MNRPSQTAAAAYSVFPFYKTLIKCDMQMNSRVCHTVRDGGTGKKGEKGIGACVGKKSGNEIIYCLKKKESYGSKGHPSSSLKSNKIEHRHTDTHDINKLTRHRKRKERDKARARIAWSI